MRVLTLFPLLIVITFSMPVSSETLDVDVNGMTCAFCVDSLQRKLRKLSNVVQVEVSLKNKKVRVDTGKAKADIDSIKQAIVDSGFTPVKINVK